MKGAMLDMYRQPDKLIEACERLYPVILERAIAGTRRTGVPRVYIPLHRGSDAFMSLKQFETFYWPGVKRLLTDLIAYDLTPCVHWEGDWTKRLEYLTELPRGKIFGYFNATDLLQAKEVLGDTMCIVGGVPNTLLQVGTSGQVIDYAKKLIDVVGKDGGFIICSRGPLDTAEPELVRVLFDFVRDYGVYKQG
jgi:uroporphyrinogen-III decarboxylase